MFLFYSIGLSVTLIPQYSLGFSEYFSFVYTPIIIDSSNNNLKLVQNSSVWPTDFVIICANSWIETNVSVFSSINLSFPSLERKHKTIFSPLLTEYDVYLLSLPFSLKLF